MTLLGQFQVVLVFLLIGIGMIVAPMVLLSVLRPQKPDPIKAQAYECGMDPVGEAQVCFDMRFYTDALVFLIFEVETVFLFPWARVFREDGWGGIALFEGLVFVGILFLGLVYVWAKGDLDWVKTTSGNLGVRRVAGEVPAYESAESRPPAPSRPLAHSAPGGES